MTQTASSRGWVWGDGRHTHRHAALMHTVVNEQGIAMKSPELPSAGHAEVRIVAADPEALAMSRRFFAVVTPPPKRAAGRLAPTAEHASTSPWTPRACQSRCAPGC